jgi:hypothetical protein
MGERGKIWDSFFKPVIFIGFHHEKWEISRFSEDKK